MDNFLYVLTSDLEKLPLDLRESICSECALSIATFYRKLRKPNSHSNIEINFIFDETKRLLNDALNRNKKICNVQNHQIMKRTLFDDTQRILINTLNKKIYNDQNHQIMKRAMHPLVPENGVKILYNNIVNLQSIFRTTILKECKWSAPSFYRKKHQTKIDISNVEKNGIVALFINILNLALDQTEDIYINTVATKY